MRTRIQIMAAAFALVIGTSMTAWSQQAQTDKSQKGKQQLASNHTRSDQEPSSGSTAHYKTGKSASMGDRIDVVGHVALPGAVVTNLRPLEDSSLQLLEVTDSTTHTLNLVDVTDPAHPKIVQKIHKPAELENSRLEVEVGHAALFAETQGTPARPVSRTITLVSLADPANPKTVRQFANVTFMTADRTRKLIYLANPEGLWILQPHSSADGNAIEKQFDEMVRNAQSGGQADVCNLLRLGRGSTHCSAPAAIRPPASSDKNLRNKSNTRGVIAQAPPEFGFRETGLQRLII